MITIKGMEFSNVMSYAGTASIDFTQAEVTQLIGKNGCGKSSIATILEEGLYNKNSRGIAKGELQHRYSDATGYEIKVTFSKDNEEYVVHKTVKSTAKVKLFKDGTDISGHTATQTYKLVEAIIGADFNTFTKLVNQSMASSLDFLTATDTNRKKFLIDLIGLEKYASMEKKAKESLKEVSTKLTQVSAKIEYITEEIGKVKDAANASSIDVPTQHDYADALSDLMVKVKELQNEKGNITTVNNGIRARNALCDSYENSLKSLPNKPEISSLLSTTAIDAEIAAGRNKLATLTDEIKKYKDIRTECFTCKRPFEDVPDMSEEISERENSKTVINAQIAELNKRKAHDEILNQELREYTACSTEISKLLQKLDNKPHKEDLKSLESIDVEILEAKKALEELRIAQTNEEDAVARAKQHNMRITLAQEKLEELEAQIAELSTTGLEQQVADYTLLKEVFSNKGLVAYKIESSIKIFEKLINDYLGELSKGQFALSFEVTESKLEVVIYDDSRRINIKSVSSGELNKINTATLLAVRKMMSAIAKVNINLLIIDEVSSVLDGESRDELTELLLKEHHLNSLMVTHEYTHPLTKKLFVYKDDKASRIEHDE